MTADDGGGAAPPALRLPLSDEFPPAPDLAALAALLDRHASFGSPPLVPEIAVFTGTDLVSVWEAADRLAGRPVPSPFWAYPWPGGVALARVILDAPERVRGRSVLDLGAGGGIAALAAARAGAARVVANDIDPWALATAVVAAQRQALTVEPLRADLVDRADALASFEVVLCGDLCYERTVAPRLLRSLQAVADGGATVLVGDPGRSYFRPGGLVRLAEFVLAVPEDVEGVARRTAAVYVVPGSPGASSGLV